MATMMANMNMVGTRTAGSVRTRTDSVADRNRELFELQRRARRGSTPEVFFAKHLDNTRIVKADDPERRKEMRMFSAVMTVLFCLAMVYVWQHFSAIEMGYKIEAQKTQVEVLREQNRQLRLNESQLTEPGRIDKMARQLGLDQPAPGQVVRTEAFTGQEAPAVASLQ